MLSLTSTLPLLLLCVICPSTELSSPSTLADSIENKRVFLENAHPDSCVLPSYTSTPRFYCLHAENLLLLSIKTLSRSSAATKPYLQTTDFCVFTLSRLREPLFLPHCCYIHSVRIYEPGKDLKFSFGVG